MRFLAVHDVVQMRLEDVGILSGSAFRSWYIQISAPEMYLRNRCDKELLTG